MENVTRALLMAFSMLIFVIAFSFSMYLINKLTTTANVLLDSVETTNYYDNLKVTGDDADKREVGVDTIVPVLYRYYKEQYSVRIMEGNTLIQLFDLGIEGKVAKAASNTNTDNSQESIKELNFLKNSIYNQSENKAYMFKAPWMGNVNEDARTRIDYFLNGTKGYINNTLVDYSRTGNAFSGTSGGFLKYAAGKRFTESFVEYVYSGETISTDERIRNNNGKYTRKFKNNYNLYSNTIKITRKGEF